MAIREIPLSEAIKKNIPMGFEINDDLLETGWGQLEESLREHGWKGHPTVVSNKKPNTSGNSNVGIGDGGSK